MYYGHVPVQVTLDSGATGNLINSLTTKSINAHIKPTTQEAHQAAGNSPLHVVGETHITLTMGDKQFQFEGLVVDNLDGDILGGVPFMAQKDISVRPARHEVRFNDGSTLIYQSDITQSSTTIRHAFVLCAPSRHTTLWTGEYLDLDIPIADDFPCDQSHIVEPRYDSK